MTFKEAFNILVWGKKAAKKEQPSVPIKPAAPAENKALVDAKIVLAKIVKTDADLLAKTTKEDANLLARETKASASLLARETKASADLLAEETKNSAEELRKSNEAYIGWTKWMTVTLIIVGLIQIVVAIIPLLKTGK